MNIAIFASGQGTNAENILNHFKDSSICVKVIVTNNPLAGVIDIAKNYDIPLLIIDKNIFNNRIKFLELLADFNLDLIVLAGFLWLIPAFLINKYKNQIINIHPALLPRYGGKGMYGMKVHRSVKESGDKSTGITIHYVNEHYDEGNIIFQANVKIIKSDTPEQIATKVHELEYKYFPLVIQDLLKEK